jgi:calpain-7
MHEPSSDPHLHICICISSNVPTPLIAIATVVMAFSTYADGLRTASVSPPNLNPKSTNKQTLASRAITTESSLPTLSPLSSPLPTLHRAFSQYVSAAEAYSHLLGSALVPAPERGTIQRKWRLVLERAEKVKRRIEALGGRVGAQGLDEAAEEAAVVRRGGVVNGVQCGMWASGGELSGEVDSGGERGVVLFRDSAQPELAAEQIRLEPSWTTLPDASWTTITTTGRWTVRQGPGADCSVTAGLGACLAHNERWGTTVSASERG